jgi:hypothetical protein
VLPLGRATGIAGLLHVTTTLPPGVSTIVFGTGCEPPLLRRGELGDDRRLVLGVEAILVVPFR